MASVTKHVLAGSDGYRVLSADEQLGWVEELWLGAADEPVAAVVRLADERRGLVVAEDVAAVAPTERSLTLAPAARLIRLDPPHVEQQCRRSVLRDLARNRRAASTSLDSGHTTSRLHRASARSG